MLFSEINGIMCRIGGPRCPHKKKNITIEEFSQHRKKKKSCPWLMNNRASDCWTIVPATVEQSCQWLLKNHASDCWTVLPATVEHLCHWLLKNYASDCWRIVITTVEQSCQWLLKNCVSDCWRIVPTAVEQLCQLFSFSLVNLLLLNPYQFFV